MVFSLISTGFASIIAQILLLRELVTVFNGNELTYGISLLIWLASTAIGSYVSGKMIKTFKDPLKALIYVQLAAAVLVPGEIYIARISKILFSIPSGSIPDLNSILIISVLSMAPACLLFGSLFTLGSKALRDISNMYVIESLGSALGGVIFSFLLIYFFDPFQIAGISGTALSLSSIYLYKNFVKPNTHPSTARLVLFSLVLAVNFTLIHPLGAKLDVYSSKAQFGGLNLVRSVDSIYGRISVLEDRGTYSYFEGGNLVYSTASVAENEEIAHLSMLESGNPHKILLIGGGPAVIPEMLKHTGIQKLDYIEFDPKLAELSASSTSPIIADGRYFIKKTRELYDLILINLGDPINASTGRFYTVEFMRQCGEKLGPQGVLALKISGSADFMSKETRMLNSSIYKTIKMAFPEVTVIPGSYIYYFASRSKGLLTDNAASLVKRWQAEKIKTGYFNSLAIPHLVSPDRLDYVNRSVKADKNVRINTDLQPISYLYSILIWISYFPGIINIALQRSLAVRLGSLIFWLFAFAVLFSLAGSKIKAVRDSTVPVIVALIGFSAMSLQLLTIYAFEAIYGYLYFRIGLLMAVFMGGLALGSYIANLRSNRSQLWQIILLLLFSIFMFGIYLNAIPMLDYRFSDYVIPIFSFLFASLVGAVFPLAVKENRSNNIDSKAGVLYGSDLLGGAFSAVLTSILFIPVFGIMKTIAVPAGLCLICLILIFQSSS